MEEEDGNNGFTPVSVVSRQVIDDSLLLRARGTKEGREEERRTVLSRTIGNLSLSLSLSLPLSLSVSADLLARSARPRNGIVAI